MRRFALLLISLLPLMAACGGEDTEDALPTRVSVVTFGPEATPEVVRTFTPTPVTETDISSPAESRTPGSAATLPPTYTATPTVTPTATLTVTPSATITDTPSPTPTATATYTMEPDPVNFLAELAREATVLPQTYVPDTVNTPGASVGGTPVAGGSVTIGTPAPGTSPTTAPSSQCQYPPPGRFEQAFQSSPALVGQIGCPVGAPPTTRDVQSAVQPFERGTMIWLNESGGQIYVLTQDGRYQRVADTFDPASDPESGGESPPSGLVAPVRGFGKVWRNTPGVRDSLGWATQGETGTTATVQEFTQGRMVYLPVRGDVLVINPGSSPAQGSWQSLPG